MADSAYNTVEMRDRTPIAIRTDNLIRQHLRIGDPSRPEDVANGLLRHFPQAAQLLKSEALGQPLVPMAYAPTPARAPKSMATSAEIRQAVDDVERDIGALTKDHRLKDIEPELQGWAQAIRSIISDGMAAARLALDPLARDRIFAARRQLGDYARLARMIGALTQTLNVHYRRFAQSLDEVASLLLILAGEVLAGAGLGGGRFLLSVPASELQSRRDAVLLALRTLAGTADQAYGNDQWPWGLHGFREMLRLIESSGHLELRALLEEPVLGRLMDELIERAAQQNVLGLRALGATADVAVQRLHRLIHLINNQVQPAAPAVTTFLKALQLFLDAFTGSRSGYRLLFVARAPIGFYGLSGIGGPDQATVRLLALVSQRGRLAELLDCYLGCECCSDDVLCQILMDKILYDTDRAIDLYTLGNVTAGNGPPERRAAAFAYLIQAFLSGNIALPDESVLQLNCLTDVECFPRVAELNQALATIRDRLAEALPVALGSSQPQAVQDLIHSELCLQQQSDQRLGSLIATLAPGCVPGDTVINAITGLINTALNLAAPGSQACAEPDILPPATTQSALNVFYRFDQWLNSFTWPPPPAGTV